MTVQEGRFVRCRGPLVGKRGALLRRACVGGQLDDGMPIRRVPEREMLRLLVACEKLTPDEAARARKLYDDLEAGSIVRLDLESRVWVQRTFRAYELTPKRPPEAGRPSKPTSKQLIAAFDAMPRPKKPPGR